MDYFVDRSSRASLAVRFLRHTSTFKFFVTHVLGILFGPSKSERADILMSGQFYNLLKVVGCP